MPEKFYVDSNGTFGPADRQLLLQWQAEGRLLPDTILRRADNNSESRVRDVLGRIQILDREKASAGAPPGGAKTSTSTSPAPPAPQPGRKVFDGTVDSTGTLRVPVTVSRTELEQGVSVAVRVDGTVEVFLIPPRCPHSKIGYANRGVMGQDKQRGSVVLLITVEKDSPEPRPAQAADANKPIDVPAKISPERARTGGTVMVEIAGAPATFELPAGILSAGRPSIHLVVPATLATGQRVRIRVLCTLQ